MDKKTKKDKSDILDMNVCEQVASTAEGDALFAQPHLQDGSMDFADGLVATDEGQVATDEGQVATDEGQAATCEEQSEQELNAPAKEIDAKKRKKRGGLIGTINGLLIFLIVVLVFSIVFMQVVIFCPVSQTSMLPSIKSGENVLLIKTKNIKRGQIFVFKTEEVDPETGQKINLIKRAIGIGGDRLVFVSFGIGENYDEVYLYRDTGNGFTLLEENYLNCDRDRDSKYYEKPMVLGNMGRCKDNIYFATGADTESFDINKADADGLLDGSLIEIEENTYFAMGDNRNNSKDSRSIGSIQKKDVLGRYWTTLTKDSFIEKLLKKVYKGRNKDAKEILKHKDF